MLNYYLHATYARVRKMIVAAPTTVLYDTLQYCTFECSPAELELSTDTIITRKVLWGMSLKIYFTELLVCMTIVDVYKQDPLIYVVANIMPIVTAFYHRKLQQCGNIKVDVAAKWTECTN